MKIFIIAEIGMNHNGNFNNALEHIKAVAGLGVDAVKFQTHIAEAETLLDAPSPAYFNSETRYDYFKRTAFSLEQHKKLKDYAKHFGIEFISSPFSLEAVDLLEAVGVATYKVPSGEVSNLPLLIKLAKTKKRILLSSGMSTWEELDEAVNTLCSNGAGDVVLMQCTSQYPTPPEDSGLNVMLQMRRRYNLPVGFSDHTLGIAISIAATTLGASVIEKHFTLSKNAYGPDAKISADPQEFRALVKGIRDVEKTLLAKVDKDNKAKSLREMKVIFEKSIVAASDIAAGTILNESHFSYKKPADGIPARKFRELIGKRTVKDIKKDTKFDWKIIES